MSIKAIELSPVIRITMTLLRYTDPKHQVYSFLDAIKVSYRLVIKLGKE
jgi:hypothetical protein